MRVVLQRVKKASVSVDGTVKGAIGGGFLALLGVCAGDTPETAKRMAEKISKLRVFPDENGKTNLSAADVKAEILIVSQFTLYADCRKGNRPSFTQAGPPDLAEELYGRFVEECRGLFADAGSGVFGAHMSVELLNDGPFTLVLDSAELGFS